MLWLISVFVLTLKQIQSKADMKTVNCLWPLAYQSGDGMPSFDKAIDCNLSQIYIICHYMSRKTFGLQGNSSTLICTAKFLPVLNYKPVEMAI